MSWSVIFVVSFISCDVLSFVAFSFQCVVFHYCKAVGVETHFVAVVMSVPQINDPLAVINQSFFEFVELYAKQKVRLDYFRVVYV